LKGRRDKIPAWCRKAKRERGKPGKNLIFYLEQMAKKYNFVVPKEKIVL